MAANCLPIWRSCARCPASGIIPAARLLPLRSAFRLRRWMATWSASICRYFALSEEMGSPKSRRMIHELAQEPRAARPPRRVCQRHDGDGRDDVHAEKPRPACSARCGRTARGTRREWRSACPSSPRKKRSAWRMRCVMLVFCQNRVLTVLQAGAPARRPFRLPGRGRGAVARADVRGARSQLGVPAAYDARLGRAQTCVHPPDLGDGDPCLRRGQRSTDVPDGRWVSAGRAGGPAHAYAPSRPRADSRRIRRRGENENCMVRRRNAYRRRSCVSAG